MRLALIFNTTRPGTTGIYFERACQRLGVTCDHWELGQLAGVPGGYDLYLRIDHGDDYLVPWPKPLRPAIFYAIDTHLPHSWRKIKRSAQRYDLVCCAQANAARALPNGAWLPLACDLDWHGAQSGEPIWDVGFVGTDGGVPRKFYLQALRERYPKSRIGNAAPEELGAIYSRARIGFNYAIADDVNMRVFEILAAHTLLMTNALSHDALDRLGLRNQQELVVYRTPQELLKLIDYYLSHPEERRRVAVAGAACVRERHTYVHRVQHLLSLAQQRLGCSGAVQGARIEEGTVCASS